MAAVTITRTARTGANDIQITFEVRDGALTAVVRFVSDDSDGATRDEIIALAAAPMLTLAERAALVATLRKLRDAAITSKGFA